MFRQQVKSATEQSTVKSHHCNRFTSIPTYGLVLHSLYSVVAGDADSKPVTDSKMFAALIVKAVFNRGDCEDQVWT
jgi:hypothetical protein